MKDIIIFGAGQKGLFLKRLLENGNKEGIPECSVKYYCDNYIEAGRYIERIEIIHAEDITSLKDELLIVISSSKIVDDVMLQLKKLKLRNEVYYVPDYTYKFMWDKDNMPFWIKMNIDKPRLPYMECKIVEHCNMNCNGCSVCANISKPNVMNLEQFESDLICLRKLYTGIKYLKLFGGEPLLHTQLTDLIYIARKYFPDAELVVHSNGILIPNMGQRLFDEMYKVDAKFVFTLYPETGKKKRIIEQILGKSGIEYSFTPPVYEFRKCINLKGDYNAAQIYQNCCKCINLIDGTLSCGIGFLVDKLETKYHVSICKNKFEHCVNIYSTQLNGWEINALLDSPFDLCRYCAFMHFNVMKDENYYYEWKHEEPCLEDWCF